MEADVVSKGLAVMIADWKAVRRSCDCARDIMVKKKFLRLFANKNYSYKRFGKAIMSTVSGTGMIK